MYDYIIVGAGPTGLFLAYTLSKYDKKKILLVDENDTIGGCHRVTREKKIYFSEHGPRVYSSGYINFKNWLLDMNLNFDDLFVPYKFYMENIAIDGIKNFTYREMFYLSKEFLLFMFSKYKDTLSVKEFCNKNNFSDKAIDYLDRLCRLTDGIDSTKYSMYKLFSSINDNFFYSLYQPKYSNDVLLMKMISTSLKINKVDIKTDFKVSKIDPCINTIYNQHKQKVEYKNIIFAIPPRRLFELNINTFPSIFSSKIEYYKKMKETDYNTYIPITFHWNIKLFKNPIEIHGFPINDWGIITLFITDYNKSEVGTIISCNISIPENKSKYLNKTAHECTKSQLIEETFRQIKDTFNLPIYDYAFIHKNVIRIESKYINTDTAYNKHKNITFDTHSSNFDNIYSVGTHNGKSNYNFTTMESAIINAIEFYNDISKNKIKLLKHTKLHHLVYICIFVLLLIVCLVFYMR